MEGLAVNVTWCALNWMLIVGGDCQGLHASFVLLEGDSTTARWVHTLEETGYVPER